MPRTNDQIIQETLVLNRVELGVMTTKGVLHTSKRFTCSLVSYLGQPFFFFGGGILFQKDEIGVF